METLSELFEQLQQFTDPDRLFDKMELHVLHLQEVLPVDIPADKDDRKGGGNRLQFPGK